MRILRGLLPLILLVSFVTAQKTAPKTVPTPSEFLGFQVGADRQLADYKQIVSYLKALDASSDRVELKSLGQTTLGNDMVMAVISSEENLRNQQRYREIARKLADPRGMSPQQIDALAKEGKLILLVTCNIHSTEVGAAQMAMEWAHQLATAQDAETKQRLSDVILLLVPSLNPDGQIMVTDYYRKYVGTKYEGGPMPWLYHHYVGHDNNRDWYMLTQKETRNMSHAVYHEWFPQFWLDEHQMGAYGPRIYVPPNADPVAKLVHPLVHRGNNLLGTNMAWRLEEAGKQGVIFGYQFDAYWPGGTRNTGWWKNMFGVLTEVASARIASPVVVAPTELRGETKGLIEYKQQINFPNPWPGGRWTLRDIIDYELIISNATLETASKYREEFLRGVATMAMDAVKAGAADEFWRIDLAKQRDKVVATRLAALLREHGAEVRLAADGNSFLIPTAQPYGKFLAEMLGVQRYPEVKPSREGGILEPYDVASWSLPLQMGVNVEKVKLGADEIRALKPVTQIPMPSGGVEGSGRYYTASAQMNNAAALANDVLKKGGRVQIAADGTYIYEGGGLGDAAKGRNISLRVASSLPPEAKPLREVRVGLYKPFLANPSMDEGWTRFILEQYGFAPKSVDAKTVKAGNLNSAFDVIILPDLSKNAIVEGRSNLQGYYEELPPEYAGGIGKEGLQALKTFVESGGTVITLASSSELVISEFNLPVRNSLAGAKESEFNVPGSLLRVHIDTKHPVNYGMPEEIAAFVDGPIAFQTSVPTSDVQRSVIAWYPEDDNDILLSGWINGAERLARKAAAVGFTRGKGKVVMFGFRVQHRAQTEGTFKMLFNAIHWAGMEAP
jgi:hypothetical protein